MYLQFEYDEAPLILYVPGINWYFSFYFLNYIFITHNLRLKYLKFNLFCKNEFYSQRLIIFVQIYQSLVTDIFLSPFEQFFDLAFNLTTSKVQIYFYQQKKRV